jgi:Sel1 repeat
LARLSEQLTQPLKLNDTDAYGEPFVIHFRATFLLLAAISAGAVRAEMTADQEYRCFSLLAVMPATAHPDIQSLARTGPRASQVVTMLEKLAREGNGDAQLAMAILSQSGYCFTQDQAAARTWMQRAAEGGNVQAQHRLGVAHLSGPDRLPVTMRLDVQQDTALGLRWLNSAAEAGNSDSQWVLAQSYENGRYGLEKDEKLAYLWYSAAKASKRVEAVAQRMEPSELEAAKKLFAKWEKDHPQPAPQSANEAQPVPGR